MYANYLRTLEGIARAALAYLLPGDAAPEACPDDIEVTRTIRETDLNARAGLSEALGAIATGQAEVLMVQRLRAAGRSLTDLIRLLDWLEANQAGLVALDLRLDTGRAEGRSAVLLLREVDRWTHEPEPPRRPPGRPGLQRTAHEVVERIVLLREQGLSLHAIAEALNAEGTPTPRGGARWRASSVQSALGYRRPRPPAPGVPPLGPPPSRGPHGGRPRRGAATPGTPGPPPPPKRKGPA